MDEYTMDRLILIRGYIEDYQSMLDRAMNGDLISKSEIAHLRTAGKVVADMVLDVREELTW